jgi:hypothetical protein
MSMTNEAISLVTAQENLYHMGLINTQQKGLLEGIKPVPIENHSCLQQCVFEFANGFLTTTNHPLAPWNQVMHGICRDANGVWSPYDLIGYQSLHQLNILHSLIPLNHNFEYMLHILHSILHDPGHYTQLVSELYPNVSTTSPDDNLIGITFLDSTRIFNLSLYMQVDVKAVAHYMWEVLKIPWNVAKFNLEPYVQLHQEEGGGSNAALKQ